MEHILSQAESAYFTTPYLLSLYSSYKHPRDKIKNLLKTGDLLHLKQGLYILGEIYNKKYSREVIAGMIYGPSAISLDYALSYHGMIPERVEELTCICFKKDKTFDTPIGRFSYRYLNVEKYSLGISWVRTEFGNFLIACPEKALCDKVYFSTIKKRNELDGYLFEELRIDEESLKNLDLELLNNLADKYKRKNCRLLVEKIAEIQKGDM